MDILRDEVLNLRKNNAILKRELQKSNQQNHTLMTNAMKIQRKYQVQQNDMDMMLNHLDLLEFQKERLQIAFDRSQERNKVLARKHFQKLGYAAQSERKRKMTQHISETLETIHEWKRARVQIQINDKGQKFDKLFVNERSGQLVEAQPEVVETWKSSKVQEFIYLMDQYSISHDAWNEIYFCSNKVLPTLYAIKKEQGFMSDCIPINVSDNLDGANRSIFDLIHYLDLKPNAMRHIHVKISGDGAMATRTKSVVTGMIRVFDVNKRGKPVPWRNDRQYANCEIPVFAYIGSENFADLSTEGKLAFLELAKLRKHGIKIGGVHHKVTLSCTSDWKANTIFGGVNSCSSKYFCFHCLICKDQKALMSRRTNWPIQRSRTQNKQLRNYQNRELRQGYVRQPLLPLEYSEYIPDYLHLCKGFIGKQFNQIVSWAIEQNNQDKLIGEMDRIGVHFRFFSEMSTDMKKSVEKWTQPPVHELRKIYTKAQLINILDDKSDRSLKKLKSLTVRDLKHHCKLRGLRVYGRKNELIQRLQTVLAPGAQLKPIRTNPGSLSENDESVELNVDALQNLWRKGAVLLKQIHDGVRDVNLLALQLRLWGQKFIKLTFPEDVTPYIHQVIYHVPFFVKKYGGLGKFQMEEVERMNKVSKSALHHKTDKKRDIMEQVMRFYNRDLAAKKILKPRPPRLSRI